MKRKFIGDDGIKIRLKRGLCRDSFRYDPGPCSFELRVSDSTTRTNIRDEPTRSRTKDQEKGNGRRTYWSHPKEVLLITIITDFLLVTKYECK